MAIVTLERVVGCCLIQLAGLIDEFDVGQRGGGGKFIHALKVQLFLSLLLVIIGLIAAGILEDAALAIGINLIQINQICMVMRNDCGRRTAAGTTADLYIELLCNLIFKR